MTYAHRNDAFADGAIPEAYKVISSLLDGIVGQLVPPFTLAKLEGDAVFAYSVGTESVPQGRDALDCISACYADFRGRIDNAHEIWTCWCEACAQLDVLDLKFVLHAGPFVMQEIAGQRELVGPEIVVAHRLLKTRAAEFVGHNAYAVVTSSAADALGIPCEGTIPLAEKYGDANVSASVFTLRTA